MQKPITSRVKRSSLLKYSPAKQTGNVEAIGSKTTKGKDKIVKETKKRLSYDEAWEQDAGGIKSKYKDKASYIADREGQRKKDPEAFEKDMVEQTGVSGGPGTKTTETTIPGEDKTVDAKLYRKDYQDVKEPWEVRRSNRAAKIQGRAQRRAQNKADKVKRQLASLAEKGITSGRKYDNLKAKETETTQELENMKQGSLNVAESRRSGKLAGTRDIRREKDVVKTMSDYQDDDAAQVRMQARKQEIAAASGVTTKQAEGAPMPGQTPFSGGLERATELVKELELNYKPGQYSQGITMKPAPFRMSPKSPATKKLQGNQSRLPQHLQDAIKAAPESPAKLAPLVAATGGALIASALTKPASSNKMRSGFKMKGYGKK